MPEIPRARRTRVARIARWLAHRAADREPVKLGIVLLGEFGDASDRPALECLVRHDEFTLFCLVALANRGFTDELGLWAIAQDVRGWGRVHVVERLSKTDDPRIRRWLVRDGFRNTIMNEYLALACAEGGDLAGELAEDSVDEELLEGAAELLRALASTTKGGPATGFEAYPEGADAVRRFLRHASRRARTWAQFHAAHELRTFVASEQLDWTQLAPHGWTEDVRAEIRAAAQRIVQLPEWSDRVRRAVSSGDREEFWNGSAAADALAIDVWEEQFARLCSARDEINACWWHVCQTTDPARMDRVIAFAEESLPLARIATGPASDTPFGDEHRAHRDLEWVLQELRRFPGRGWNLLRTGLRSPVIRNRNMALAALAAWDRAAWPSDAAELLATAARAEPVAETRATMEGLLRGDQPPPTEIAESPPT